MAFDVEEISQAVRELAARHEKLHENLSRVTGPVADYEGMTSPALAKYGLEKLGLEAPEDEEACVVALEFFLHGRAGRESGVAGMDSAGKSHVDRYLNSN
jgi:hypothetical protein